MVLCNSENYVITIFCICFGVATLYAPSQFDSCYAPTQVFVIETLSLICIQRLVVAAKSQSFLPSFIRNSLTALLYLIVNPAFIYVTIQGLIWHIMNISETPECEFMQKKSILIWMMLAVLTVVDILIIFTTVSTCIMLRKFREIRRRQSHVNEVEILEEYINTQLNLIFLSGALNGEDASRASLTSADIEKLPRSTYNVTADSSRQGYGDDCPVCFEDFKDGEEVSTLPGCSHVFHWKCVHEWFKMSPLCPVCRANVRDSLIADGYKLGMETLGNPGRVDIEVQLLVPQ